MEINNKTIKKNSSGLVKALYVLAAVLAAVFLYMLVVNIMYISSYSASYGMAFSDMWQEAIQYIVTGSVSYLVYAALVFCAGKILDMLSTGAAVSYEDAATDDAEDISFDPDRVINRFNKEDKKEEKSVTVHLKQRKKKRNI